uniref:NADH-ubiquinone oxidoreductase chain 2 n=1 Tax=Amblyomma cajennense TaxID=34607 RepID=L7PC63_AMBCJ|nr:NADH dehydrogenase subunit 2 [Amblyomma cajennense]AFU55264.1 NADH dehydrogenase subunit 2 [Amblyomma cajennense]
MLFKNVMKWLIVMTILISLSSNSWFILWLMMEMNLLIFISILNKKKMNNSNLMVSYFVIQSFSSTIFFWGSLNFLIFQMFLFKMIMNISMLIKLAVVPFHFWLTSLSEMIDFSSLWVILTMQKMIPLIVLYTYNVEIIIMFAAISSIIGSILALNSKTIKKILIFSSISHQGWMISLILMKSNFWLTYLLIYSTLIFKISSSLTKVNFINMTSLFFINNKYPGKISIISMMLSLGGMPPFLGFFIKLMSIIILINNFNIIIIILIMSSMINIYFYLRIFTPLLFLNYFSFKNYFKSNYSVKNFILTMNVIFSIFLLNVIMF